MFKIDTALCLEIAERYKIEFKLAENYEMLNGYIGFFDFGETEIHFIDVCPRNKYPFVLVILDKSGQTVVKKERFDTFESAFNYYTLKYA